MKVKEYKPTKKHILIGAGVLVGILLFVGIGIWLAGRLADTPALKVGEKVVYTRDYNSFIAQAESSGFTKKDARLLLIDYYRLQEAARVSKFPVSNEYIENRREFYKKQNPHTTDAVARAQAYRSAVQRVINLRGIEGVEARLVRLPFQSNPSQYGLPTKEEAKKLIESARKDIIERKSDKGIGVIIAKYPDIDVVSGSIFSTDGLMIGDDGRTIYKPITVLKDDIKDHIANCKNESVCAVQEVEYTGTFFFMHIIDRVKKVTIEQVQAFDRARKQVKVVEYIDEK